MHSKEFLSLLYAKNTKKSDIALIYDAVEYNSVIKYRLAHFVRN